jgi:hypothetical protein
MDSIPGVRPVLFVHPFDSFPAHRAIRIADIAPERSRLAGGGGLAEWVRVNKEIEHRLRLLGKGRCEKLEIRRKKKPAQTGKPSRRA